MNPQIQVTVMLFLSGFLASWFIWVTSTIFKHSTEIALVKKELEILEDIKGVLTGIKSKL